MGKLKRVFNIFFKKKNQAPLPKRFDKYIALLKNIDSTADIDDVVYLIPASLTADNIPRKHLVVMFSSYLAVYAEGGEKTVYQLSEISDFVCVKKFGCISLECKISGKPHILCNSNMRQGSEFSAAAYFLTASKYSLLSLSAKPSSLMLAA